MSRVRRVGPLVVFASLIAPFTILAQPALRRPVAAWDGIGSPPNGSPSKPLATRLEGFFGPA